MDIFLAVFYPCFILNNRLEEVCLFCLYIPHDISLFLQEISGIKSLKRFHYYLHGIIAESRPFFLSIFLQSAMTKYIKIAMTSETESATSELVSSQVPATIQTANIPESGTLRIISHNLNDNNYNQWSHSVMIFVCGKGKEDYVTSAIASPAEDSPG